MFYIHRAEYSKYPVFSVNLYVPKIKINGMSIISEFKQFAVKGNVIDLAVGVIIGAAFGRIVTSLVNDIIMPPIGVITGGVDFKDLKYVLSEPVLEGGKVIAEGASLNYGSFIQTLVDFFLIAMAIFALVTAINTI